MSAAEFFDTNILLYAVGTDDAKRKRAQSVLNTGGTISVQVLGELVSVARRKLGRSWPDIREALALLNDLLPDVVPLTAEIHARAVDLAERFGLHIYDGLIVAAALEAGCKTLYTEDLQDGQKIDGLTIRNPFAGSS